MRLHTDAPDLSKQMEALAYRIDNLKRSQEEERRSLLARGKYIATLEKELDTMRGIHGKKAQQRK